MAATVASRSTPDIPKPQGLCAVTGQPIAPGDRFVAGLREIPEGLQRVDLSAAAWADYDRASLLAYWHMTMPAASTKKKMYVDDAVLCEIFERLAEAVEEPRVAFRFVLGLMLMRKKLLICDDIRRDNAAETWVVRLKGREGQMDLVNPHLDESRISQVVSQLSEVLAAES